MTNLFFKLYIVLTIIAIFTCEMFCVGIQVIS